MSSKGNRRHSIRKGSFGKKARGIARRVDEGINHLIWRKKDEIKDFVTKELRPGIEWSITRNSKRALYVELHNIDASRKTIRLEFIFWTDQKNKPKDWDNSRAAGFFLRHNEDIREKILNYLEGIQKGLVTEYLGLVALEELEKVSLEEKQFKYFRRAKPLEDRNMGEDFIVVAIKDGREIEIPVQLKSSYEKLMKHKERFPKVPGLFREFTGNLEEEIKIIKEKIVKIIYAYKDNKIIYI